MEVRLYDCGEAHIESYNIEHCARCRGETDDEDDDCGHCVDDPAVDHDDGGCERQQTLIDDPCPDCDQFRGTDEN